MIFQVSTSANVQRIFLTYDAVAVSMVLRNPSREKGETVTKEETSKAFS